MNIADDLVFEYIRTAMLHSRMLLALDPSSMPPFEDELVRELALLPTTAELREKLTPARLRKEAEKLDERREDQSQKLVQGFGDKARKEFDERVAVDLLLCAARRESSRTPGKPKSKKELVREHAELTGRHERTVRRLFAKNPAPYTLSLSFDISRLPAKCPEN